MQGLDPEWLSVASLKWYDSIAADDQLHMSAIVARTIQKYNENSGEELVIPMGLALTFITYGAILSQLIDSKMVLIKPDFTQQKEPVSRAWLDFEFDTEGI